MTVESIREAIASHSAASIGASQMRGRERGVTVIDDYGHHPTEIRATLAAARLCFLWHIHVLFQPHRYTRTRYLMDEFGTAFHQADDVYVLDIYAASEPPIEGVNSQALLEQDSLFRPSLGALRGQPGSRASRAYLQPPNRAT